VPEGSLFKRRAGMRGERDVSVVSTVRVQALHYPVPLPLPVPLPDLSAREPDDERDDERDEAGENT
jgi:hypothetical protein